MMMLLWTQFTGLPGELKVEMGEWVMGAPSLAVGDPGREQGQLVDAGVRAVGGEEIQQLRRGELGSAQPRWCGFCIH